MVASVKKLEHDILVQIDDAIKSAHGSYARIGATRQARDYAEAALAAEQKKLAGIHNTDGAKSRGRQSLAIGTMTNPDISWFQFSLECNRTAMTGSVNFHGILSQ